MEIYSYKGRLGTLGKLGNSIVFNYRDDANESEFIGVEELPLLQLVRNIPDRESLSEDQCDDDATPMRRRCDDDATVMRHQCDDDANEQTRNASNNNDNGIKYEEYLVNDAAAIRLLRDSNFVNTFAPKYRNYTEFYANVPKSIVQAVNQTLKLEGREKYSVRTLSPVVVAMRLNDRIPKPKVFFMCFASFVLPATLCFFLIFDFPKNENLNQEEKPKIEAVQNKQEAKKEVKKEEIKLTQSEIDKVEYYITIISAQKNKQIYPYRRGLITKACQDLKNKNQLTDANIKATVTKFVNELI